MMVNGMHASRSDAGVVECSVDSFHNVSLHKHKFFDALDEVPDAERVIDETTDHPEQKPPYVLFHP